METASIRAVGFDLDNTLVDRDGAFRRLMDSWVGQDALDEVAAKDSHGISCRAAFFDWLALRFPQLDGDLWGRFQREIADFVEPIPGVAPLLQGLTDEGFAVAILSNGGSKLQRAKLAAAGLERWFPPDRILISEEIGFEKPDPRAFAALREVLSSDEVLFVGDQLDADIKGAKRAGLQACWLGGDRSEALADSVIARITDLEHLLLSSHDS